jgi:sugar phosphate isomerase/epimerase
LDISLAPLTLRRHNPLEAIAAAGGAGYDLTGIQLRIYGQPLPRFVSDPDFVTATRDALGASGIALLEVSNLVLDENFSVDETRKFVGYAAAVGARVVQVVSWDDEPDRAVENLVVAADLAADSGLGLIFEFLPYSMTRRLEDAVSLVATAGRENVKLVLDSLHLFRSGGSVASIADVDPSLFGVVQLSDAPLHSPEFEGLRPESISNRLVPGTGELPLRELLAVLSGGLPVSLEVPCRDFEGRSLTEQARFVLEGSRRFFSSAA